MRRDRLLLADDNEDVRWLVKTIVGPKFGEVIETSDGRDLFWWLMRSSYRGDHSRRLVVIADVWMPVYSGLDVVAACEDLGLHVPTIVITSYPSPEVRARAAELGVVVLPKPFSAAELKHVVDEAQSREQWRAETC